MSNKETTMILKRVVNKETNFVGSVHTKDLFEGILVE
jgi:hypothetical protein